MLERISQRELESMSAEQRLARFRSMAESYMKEHKCRWSEACLEVKRRYPEARAAFGAPPKIA